MNQYTLLLLGGLLACAAEDLLGILAGYLVLLEECPDLLDTLSGSVHTSQEVALGIEGREDRSSFSRARVGGELRSVRAGQAHHLVLVSQQLSEVA